MSDAIILQNLTKKFGRFVAVDNVSFSVKRGEIFGFLGANGAGKSTTIRMMCGLLKPTSGKVIVDEIDVVQHPDAVKERIGYMSQRFSLYDDIEVIQNIAFFGGVYGLRGNALRQRIAWALHTAGLTNKEQFLTRNLAGGVKQRLALACALIHEPGIIFLDEPTGGVDPLSRREFWALIQELADNGITIVVTTHFLDEAEYCHRIAMIDKGRIIALGAPDDIKKNYLPYDLYLVQTDQPLNTLSLMESVDQVKEVALFGLTIHAAFEKQVDAKKVILKKTEEAGIQLHRCEAVSPTIEDVFIHLVEAG